MADDSTDLIDIFEDLLETERKLLRAGDLDGLGRILTKKEALVARLSRLAPETEGLPRLKRGLERNAVLLNAAGEGLRHAARRLHLFTHGAPLTTYDVKGRRNTVDGDGPSFSRSA